MSNTTEQEGAEKEDLSSSKSESDVPTLSSSPGRTYSGQEKYSYFNFIELFWDYFWSFLSRF